MQASHLLKYDSMLGTFKADVKIVDNETISVDGKNIKVVSNRDPLKLPWAELGIDIVIEVTKITCFFFNETNFCLSFLIVREELMKYREQECLSMDLVQESTFKPVPRRLSSLHRLKVLIFQPMLLALMRRITTMMLPTLSGQ